MIRVPVLAAICLTYSLPSLAQTQEQVTRAFSNLHSEMATCIAFYAVMKGCLIEPRDKDAIVQTQTTVRRLIEVSHPIGKAIGMTDDAMKSRITMAGDEMKELIASSCVNVASLLSRHGARCKQVVENGDSVLNEYLGKR